MKIADMPWNPDRYHQFQSQRAAPFDDLLALVVLRPDLSVVDLGCGTGELTLRLADSLPGSSVLGLDLSPEMLARASPHARPGLRFEQGDQSRLAGKWDLIFSNAALHWSEDHEALIGHLYNCLNADGQLAVQVPSNESHISHRLVVETAGEEPFRSRLAGWVRHSPVLSIEAYARHLYDLGAEDITVFEKVYPHVLEDADAVLAWISGTTLVPYFEKLGDQRETFTGALSSKLREAMPGSPVFYPFKRTFFSARRPG